ncbi:segregation and condensation protein A [Sedimenticola sp.]|uniref:segregation and condensation protein A n=1 Tax=Sedimenticola sp. TaxID=1940285 RepID=UPI003D0C0FAA
MSDTPIEHMSKEEIILKAMRLTLLDVIRDTTPRPGAPRPLSDETVEEMRKCLLLITDRERELALDQGRETGWKPHFADDPARPVVVPFPNKEKPDRK